MVFYTVYRDSQIKYLGSVCSQRIHDHFSDAYSTLPYGAAYSLESEAQAQCIERYPLPY